MQVTHPYHPLFQQEFELVSYRRNWGENRVWFQDRLGRLHSLPTSWTDAGAVDPFVALAAGRSLFRVADLEVALTVQQELQSRLEEADRLRQKQVERAQYEVDLARRRYMRVDPDNRLVADSLEAEWNSKLRTLSEAQQNRECQREQDKKILSDQQRAAILSLATDFPRLWRDANTPDRERKRMIRLLLEDVTLVRGEKITLHIRFKGGATKTLMVPTPLNAWQHRATNPAAVKEIDRLLDHHTYQQIVSILNERGLHSGEGKPFSVRIVARIQKRYGLKPRYDRLRKAGMLTAQEMASLLGITPQWVKIWNRHGLIRGHACNGKNDCL